MGKEIVPSKKIAELSADELRELREDVVEITAIYEEGSTVLAQLTTDVDKLKSAGARYQTLAKEVSDKINVVQATGIIGKVK